MSEFLWKNLPNLLIGFPDQRPGGLALSLLLAGTAIGFGFGLALLVGMARTSPFWLLRQLAMLYVNIFRGLPLLLLLLLIHQFVGGRRFGLSFSPTTSALISLTLYTSAYQAEVIRAGLLAVPREMVESARSMGASVGRVFWVVRLRYALHVMLPALVNEVITLFKDSSVVVVLGVGDLMMVARAALGSNVKNAVYWIPMYLLVGGLYALVALVISRLAIHWENRLSKSKRKIII